MKAKRSSKVKKIEYAICFCFLCLLILSATACQSLQLESTWKDREIKIDGRSDDWVGRMMFMDSPNVSLGIQNDKDFIYICLIAEDPSIRNRINMRGMILWFDPAGGKKKTLGINFPIGRQDVQMNPREKMNPGEERDPVRMRQQFQASLAELEILQSGRKEPLRISVDNLNGIEVSLNSASGLLIYEAKVPLLNSQAYPFSIGSPDGSLIGVGLEVPKMDMNQRPGGMGGGTGGRGGTGGGMGGRGGMGSGMGRPGGTGRPMANTQQAIKIWATVQLATVK